ncbi:hypothetical protein [Veillonella sp.]
MMHNETYQNVSNKEPISCNLSSIYGDTAHHICCLIPVYIDGGDYTHCYYVDGRHEIIHKSIKSVLRDVARHEGVLANGVQSPRSAKPMYTDPRTLAPNMTFACLKARKPIGRDVVYGLFNVIIPFTYHIEPGPMPHTTYIIIGDFDPILVFHSPDHVQRKLRDALLEHLDYTKRILAKLSTCGNPYVVAEIYGASRTLAGV